MSANGRRPPSDHILRTLAAVPPSSKILELGCGRARHTEALLRLGFPVHACDPRPDAVEETRIVIQDLLEEGSADTVVQKAALDSLDYPDELFDWVLVAEGETILTAKDELELLFEEARRLLKPGGWLYISLPGMEQGESDRPSGAAFRFTERQIEEDRQAADLAEASAPTPVEAEEGTRIRAIYRRVEPHTPA